MAFSTVESPLCNSPNLLYEPFPCLPWSGFSIHFVMSSKQQHHQDSLGTVVEPTRRTLSLPPEAILSKYVKQERTEDENLLVNTSLPDKSNRPVAINSLPEESYQHTFESVFDRLLEPSLLDLSAPFVPESVNTVLRNGTIVTVTRTAILYTRQQQPSPHATEISQVMLLTVKGKEPATPGNLVDIYTRFTLSKENTTSCTSPTILGNPGEPLPTLTWIFKESKKPVSLFMGWRNRLDDPDSGLRGVLFSRMRVYLWVTLCLWGMRTNCPGHYRLRKMVGRNGVVGF